MGILTGALLAGIIAKYMGTKKKSSIKPEEIAKLHQVKKIAVIGCAGSGKTYVTFKLHEKLALPVVHLDQYHWLPGWQRIDEQVFTKAHHDLCAQERWIIEGIYFRHVRERIQAADAIIFLDISRWTCLFNVIKRAVLNCGKEIPGNPEGCKQQIFSYKFLEFLSWIWNFNNKHRQTVLDTLVEFKDSKQIFIMTSQQQVQDFLKVL